MLSVSILMESLVLTVSSALMLTCPLVPTTSQAIPKMLKTGQKNAALGRAGPLFADPPVRELANHPCV